MKTKDCETCGNPIPVASADCRFCESQHNGGNHTRPRDKVCAACRAYLQRELASRQASAII